MLLLAVVLGATGGSVLGVVTAPGSSGDVAQQLGPPKEAAAPTTGRPRGRGSDPFTGELRRHHQQQHHHHHHTLDVDHDQHDNHHDRGSGHVLEHLRQHPAVVDDLDDLAAGLGQLQPADAQVADLQLVDA